LKTNRIISQVHRQHYSQESAFPATIGRECSSHQPLRKRLTLVFKRQHSVSVSSLVLEKRTLLRCFQPCYWKRNAPTAFLVFVLKNQRCCGDSSAGFEKRTLLQQFQCWYRKTNTAV